MHITNLKFSKFIISEFTSRVFRKKTADSTVRSFFGRRVNLKGKALTQFFFIFGFSRYYANIFSSMLSASSYFIPFGPQMNQFTESNLSSTVAINRFLKRSYLENLKSKRDVGVYSFLRQTYKLPSRGQRSKTNAKTSKAGRFLKILLLNKTICLNHFCLTSPPLVL